MMKWFVEKGCMFTMMSVDIFTMTSKAQCVRYNVGVLVWVVVGVDPSRDDVVPATEVEFHESTFMATLGGEGLNCLTYSLGSSPPRLCWEERSSSL